MYKSSRRKLLETGALIIAFWSATPAALPDTAGSAGSSNKTASSNQPTAQASPSPAVSGASSQTLGSRVGHWPVCIAGFACGTIAGIPICFVRKMPSEFHNLGHGLVGSITNKDCKVLTFAAGIAWLPFSTTAALIEAPAYAWKNAYMAEKPFSKEQFSLGQMDAPDKQHVPDPN